MALRIFLVSGGGVSSTFTSKHVYVLDNITKCEAFLTVAIVDITVISTIGISITAT